MIKPTLSKLYLCCIIMAVIGCNQPPEHDGTPATIRILFGSCAHQDKKQPMLRVAARQQPDVFIFLGDNIYGDTRNMDTLLAKYARLAAKPEFQALKDSTRILATWDDHDYGENDAGRHYPYKKESKEIFMDFWEVPENSIRRKHQGIYGVEYLEKDGLKVQIVLLDTRTFRDDLRHRTTADTAFKNDYVPYLTADSTLLGEAQWKWLDTVLRMPADLRIIASSNQFSHSYNGWESWTNLPHERQRMIDLIGKTGAEHLLFVSGDVHWGEISRLDVPGGYPIYDVTSSGITETWPDTEPNTNRLGEVVRQNNIGCIELRANLSDTIVYLGLIDSSIQLVEETQFALKTLEALP